MAKSVDASASRASTTAFLSASGGLFDISRKSIALLYRLPGRRFRGAASHYAAQAYFAAPGDDGMSP